MKSLAAAAAFAGAAVLGVHAAMHGAPTGVIALAFFLALSGCVVA